MPSKANPAFFATAIAIALFCGFSRMAFAQNATLTYAEGDVRTGLPGKLLPSTAGAALTAGDIIVTGKNSTAILTLEDGSQLKLNAETELQIATLRDSREFLVEKGGVFSRVKFLVSKIAKAVRMTFKIRTKGAVMGVRGTEFFTSYGKTAKDGAADVWMCVREGLVEVESLTDKKTTLVKEGEGVLVSAEKGVTPPRPYEWTKSLNWNMDPAQGTVKDAGAVKKAYGDLLKHNYD